MINKKNICILGLVVHLCMSMLTASSDFHDLQNFRIAFFKEQFAQMPAADDFKLELLGLLCVGCTYEKLLYLARKTKEMAQENNDCLGIKYFHEALSLYDSHGEKACNDDRLYELKLHTAYHEAGHAVAKIINEDGLRALYYVTLEQRGSSGGHCKDVHLGRLSDLSMNEREILLKNDIKYSLGGGIADQLFNRPVVERLHNIDHVDKNNQEYDFLDYISRFPVVFDVLDAYKSANILILLRHDCDKNYIPTDAEKVQILFELYKETRAQLSCHKDTIENLALVLMRKETVFADEVYGICGKKRPKFYFEK